MKKSLLATLLVFSSTLFCLADDAPIRPDINELLTVMRVEKSMNMAMEQMRQVMSRSTMNALQKANAGDAEKAAQLQGKVMDMVQEELAWPKLKPEIAKIYAEEFSPEETKGLIAFFKSPSGQTFLDKQPELMKKSMMLTQGKVMQLMPKIQAMVQAEAQPSGAQKATPAAK